jgi:hypothetical protein
MSVNILEYIWKDWGNLLSGPWPGFEPHVFQMGVKYVIAGQMDP